MSVITLVLWLAFLGAIYWLFNRKIPVPGGLRTIINYAIIAAGILLLLHAFGILDELRGLQVPRL